METDSLRNKAKNAPRTTGVYLMTGKKGKVIYIGKAKNLRSRIRSYFTGTDTRPMISFLVPKIHDLEFIVTDTEKEALILENNLIKEHKPRYNVDLRDDKAFFNIRIDTKSPFPRFELVRRVKKDGAQYFGPYSSSASVKDTLHFLQQIFPLRTCSNTELKSRKRPCIEYEIKRCTAPCCGLIKSKEYDKLVKDAVIFLEGREKKLLSALRSRMTDAARKLRFEEAAVIRNRLAAIRKTLEKQRIVSMSFIDRDVFGLYMERGLTKIYAMFIRKGKIIGRKSFPLVKIGADSSEILSSLMKRYYDGDVFIPEEIIIPEDIDDGEVVAEWLTEKRGRRVSIVVPKRGQKKDLLDMAGDNAKNIFLTERNADHDKEEALQILSKQLHLKRVPKRIECFDISNLGGTDAVGSMVTFAGGSPRKSEYRRFRIKTVHGMDDYAMIYEALKRRYKGKENMPDLIIVDGGKGQLGVALTVMKELEIKDIDIIGLAKEAGNGISGRKSTSVRKEEDRVYIPKRKDPVYLTRYPNALFLLQRVRDEAHRFAISYHRKLKKKKDFYSVLDGIPAVGEFRKKALLTHFGDINKIKKAPIEELQKVSGIGKETAGQIHNFFLHTVVDRSDSA
jgi:excinuclease ABC subunit C